MLSTNFINHPDEPSAQSTLTAHTGCMPGASPFAGPAALPVNSMAWAGTPDGTSPPSLSAYTSQPGVQSLRAASMPNLQHRRPTMKNGGKRRQYPLMMSNSLNSTSIAPQQYVDAVNQAQMLQTEVCVLFPLLR